MRYLEPLFLIDPVLLEFQVRAQHDFFYQFAL